LRISVGILGGQLALNADIAHPGSITLDDPVLLVRR